MESFINDQIKALASKIIELHNFSYNSFSSAKKTIRLGKIEHCFDALSLYEYSSSLNEQEKNELSHYLRDYFAKNINNDHCKCTREYGVLFCFVQSIPYLYTGYTISKEIRPDFVLTDTYNTTKIGIEVVELITQQDGIMRKIANRNFGKGKTMTEIYESAKEKHGTQADQFKYSDFDGRVAISPKGLIDVTQMFFDFSSEILKKWQKYKDMIIDFDKFIVLCDARLTIITSKNDCDSIISHLELSDANISGMSICFLYIGDKGLTIAEYSL